MKITELLDLKGIELGVSVGSKEEAINKLVSTEIDNVSKIIKH